MTNDIRIALAGAGAFGIKHLDGLKEIDGAEVVSLVGRRLDPTREVADRSAPAREDPYSTATGRFSGSGRSVSRPSHPAPCGPGSGHPARRIPEDSGQPITAARPRWPSRLD